MGLSVFPSFAMARAGDKKRRRKLSYHVTDWSSFKNNHSITMTSKKNFFVKTDDQKEALKKTLSDFGTQQLSFLDAIIGGDVPTLPGFLKVDPPYAESTKYVQIY